MNHYALLVKLWIENYLAKFLEQWFSIAVTCVKWNGCISQFFHLLAGVRQSEVLSPVLFAIFIDSVLTK